MAATWQARALCRGGDPAIWHPAPGDSDTVAQAKLICARCPVRSECLSDALASEERQPSRFGVRGGLTPRERTVLVRRLRPADQREPATSTERLPRTGALAL